MRMLIAAVALATIVASPASAQSYMGSVGSGNIAPRPYNPQAGVEHQARPYEPQAAAPAARQSSDRLYLYSGDRARKNSRATPRSSGRLYLYSGDRVQNGREAVPAYRDPNLEFQLNRESLQGQW
jgi:hypothetical protein